MEFSLPKEFKEAEKDITAFIFSKLEKGNNILIGEQIRLRKHKEVLEFVYPDDWYSQYWSKLATDIKLKV